jgi:thioredoxin 2
MSDVLADESGVIVTCATCGQKNRLPFASLDRTAKCGKCHNPLSRPGVPITVTSTPAFDALVSQSPVPVLVDFWAPWCGPCHMVAPEVVKVAASEASRLVVAKVDTDALPDVGARFGIRSIPTMAVFAGGREAGRTMGARPAKDIVTFVNQTLTKAGVSTT